MPEAPSPAPAPRLASVDVLRGFTMFWIIGADNFVHALTSLETGNEAGPLHRIAQQLSHRLWSGLSFYDLIFPLFIFTVGVSIVLAVPRQIAEKGRGAAVGHLLSRTLDLFVLGLFYNGGFAVPSAADIRVAGVLQRIALCYLAGGTLLVLGLRWRGILFTALGLLVGYWALLRLPPIGGIGAPLIQGQNITDYIDQLYLPGRLYFVNHDPEGILSTLPAIASCLFGMLVGWWMLRADLSGRRRMLGLFAGAAALVLAGLAWSLEMQVIKELWTPPFALIAAGCSVALLAVFYAIVDLGGYTRWATIFVWIGANSVFIYLLVKVVNFNAIANLLVGGFIAKFFNTQVLPGLGNLIVATVSLVLSVAVTAFLHHRKVFIKV